MPLLDQAEERAASEKDASVGISLNETAPVLSEHDMEAGVQPIDALMHERSWSNHDVVAAGIGSGLTHKQVAKARRGRRLTLHLQNKIVAALNQLVANPGSIRREDCFNYRGH